MHDSTSMPAIRPPFDSHSTAIRPFDDLRYGRIGLPECGLQLYDGLNK